jgi:hypothetical protein
MYLLGVALSIAFNEIPGAKTLKGYRSTRREVKNIRYTPTSVQDQILRLLEILKNVYVALNFDRSDRVINVLPAV